jgi:hypothetical protein
MLIHPKRNHKQMKLEEFGEKYKYYKGMLELDERILIFS